METPDLQSRVLVPLRHIQSDRSNVCGVEVRWLSGVKAKEQKHKHVEKLLFEAMSDPCLTLEQEGIASKEAGQALVCNTNPNFEVHHHHLLHCLEKTTNHEFVDEKMFESSCREVTLMKQVSRSSSVSSSSAHGFSSCCSRRKRKTFNVPNSNMCGSAGQHPGAEHHPDQRETPHQQVETQQLNTVEVQVFQDHGSRFRSRSSLNAKLEETVPLNCEQPYVTTAVISLPTPPGTSPEANESSDYSQTNIVRCQHSKHTHTHKCRNTTHSPGGRGSGSEVDSHHHH
ncbi:hypothetical protein INR49_008851 [Caranx melampygus]|nr:hypothetical protein INR49_008851 [Caranx melampygus]